MKAGAQIRFNMHYHSDRQAGHGSDTGGFPDLSKEYVPKHVISTVLSPNNDDLDIPAGADNVRSMRTSNWRAVTADQLYASHAQPRKSAMPRGHLSQHDGGTNQLHQPVQLWMQIVYNYADDVAPLLPAGTIMHTTNWHDNSTKNPWNPDRGMGRIRESNQR